MPDKFSEQLRRLRADQELQGLMMQELARAERERAERMQAQLDKLGTSVIAVGDKMDEAADMMIRVGEQTRRAGEEARRAGEEARAASAEARKASAESDERFNQLAGRLKLTEGRTTKMLSAVDTDRAELRELYKDLDARLTEVEKRLPPP